MEYIQSNYMLLLLTETHGTVENVVIQYLTSSPQVTLDPT